MAKARLFQAPRSLSACLFGAVHRDTRGAGLSAADRLNHFPISALVAITLVEHGELFLVQEGGDWRDRACLSPLSRLTVSGPTDKPTTSWATGDILATTFAFFPDAWRRLGGGTDCSEIPDGVATSIRAFEAAGDPDAGWSAFCDALALLLTNARDTSWTGASGVADWTRSLAARAALSTRGRSLRAFERRLKRLSGHTRRTLAFHAAFEDLHRVARTHAGEPLAEIAAEAGYADQSHMGRAVKRATGFTPAYLNRAIETEEAFWCYRLLGERF